jgi:hypothetical protein
VTAIHTPPRRELTLEIEKQLKTGITIGQDTLRFMASTFSIETPQALGELLAKPDDCDSRSLLELLFTPDEAVRVNLEAAIERHPFDDRDQQAIIHRLVRKEIAAPLQFQGDPYRMVFNLNEDLVETYVRGLNITVRLPPDLVAAIDTHTAGRLNHEIKAVLRSARTAWSRPICTFLGKLIEKTAQPGPLFRGDLELCLAIFGEQSTAPPLFDLFMSKKRGLLVMLQQAARFEKQLALENMETLMLKGVRVPHIDQVETGRQITRIDAICLAVFGVTDTTLQIPIAVDLGDFRSRADLDRAFEILT